MQFLCMTLLFASCSLSLAFPSDVVNNEDWHGKWFPGAPDKPDTNPVVNENQMHMLHDANHGIKMGVSSPLCDDGKTNLTLDWDGSPEAYTCYTSKRDYWPNPSINPISSCVHIPKNYWAIHRCMNTTIEYDDPIPTFGTHRPLWAEFGEYKYLPKQRWLHNLEHGSVVMLYHPCADPQEVLKLKSVVRKCLYRHVITPYNLLEPQRPLALLTWGCHITMSMVDEDILTSFIKTHALKGPETISRNGQYKEELLTPALFVSDQEDSQLCPLNNTP